MIEKNQGFISPVSHRADVVYDECGYAEPDEHDLMYQNLVEELCETGVPVFDIERPPVRPFEKDDTVYALQKVVRSKSDFPRLPKEEDLIAINIADELTPESLKRQEKYDKIRRRHGLGENGEDAWTFLFPNEEALEILLAVKYNHWYSGILEWVKEPFCVISYFVSKKTRPIIKWFKTSYYAIKRKPIVCKLKNKDTIRGSKINEISEYSEIIPVKSLNEADLLRLARKMTVDPTHYKSNIMLTLKNNENGVTIVVPHNEDGIRKNYGEKWSAVFPKETWSADDSD